MAKWGENYFLTALSQEVVRILSSGELNNFEVAKAIYKNLDERHIQLYLHNIDAQEAISDAYWDGEVKIPACTTFNCYADFIGFAEANLGVNKANHYVTRSFNITTAIDESGIDRVAQITLSNNANEVVGETARYKAYMRVIVPKGSVFDEVVVKGIKKSVIKPDLEYFDDRVEAGVFVDISPGLSSTIVFQWSGKTNLKFENDGEYRMYVRKQAGTYEDPLRIVFDYPDAVLVNSIPKFTLTDGELHGYNTTLVKDKYLLTYW